MNRPYAPHQTKSNPINQTKLDNHAGEGAAHAQQQAAPPAKKARTTKSPSKSAAPWGAGTGDDLQDDRMRSHAITCGRTQLHLACDDKCDRMPAC